MKHLKHLISGLLIASLLLSCLAGIPALRLEASAATVASGTCGDNVTWTLDDTDTLTISGTGPMTNYISVLGQPWHNYNSIKSVVIKKGVTSIGDYAFQSCTGLTSITIPDSVTSIGDHAFQSCTSLTSVTIPDSVTSIGKCAFIDCDNLTSVVIPDSVTNIGDQAFSSCDGLTSIAIPASVTTISGSAFSGCSNLTSMQVEKGNPVYHSAGNCIIETKSKTLIAGCKASQIPTDGSVTSIGSYAFYDCSNLTSIIIPDSVTSIGMSAFCFCTGLTSVIIPDSVTSIGSSAFWRCYGLTSVTIPGSVTSIGMSAFCFCTGLTSITIPDGITRIEGYTFEDCTGLTSITIPDSVTSIGRYAFESCSSLKEIYFEGSAPYIENDAFLNITATAYYNPDATWTISVKQGYGGTITWLHRSVSVSYTSFGNVGDPITIEIFPEGSQEATYTFTNAAAPANSGTWSLGVVKSGSYTVKVTKKNHIAREYTLSVAGNGSSLNVKICPLGDVDGDGKVNFSDYGKVLAQAKGQGSLEGYASQCADVNGDGKINFSDYGKVLSQAKGNHTLW